MRWIRISASLAVGVAFGAITSALNNVPVFLGEIGEARVDRSGWSRAAEFPSLIVGAGWAWAAMAVAVGWLVGAGVRPVRGVFAGALAGSVGLLGATGAYYLVDLLSLGDFSWGIVGFWCVASLVTGLPLGAAGASVRRPGLAGVLAALVVPAGAAASMILQPPPIESPVATWVQLTVWAGVLATTVMVVVRVVRARRLSTGDFAPGNPAGPPADDLGGAVS